MIGSLRWPVSFRLLPVLILTAGLMLGLKLMDLAGRGETGLSSVAIAQNIDPPAAERAGAAPPEPDRPANRDPDTERAGTGSGFPDDPTLFTQAEIDLLQTLAGRRETLERRENDLILRERLLEAAELRIDRKIGQLAAIQADLRSMLKTYDETQEATLESLSTIYARMKPKEAARIMMEMEGPILLDVLERMREAVAANIMANLSPEKARDITMELALRRRFQDDAKRILEASRPAAPDEVPAARAQPAAAPETGAATVQEGDPRGAPPMTRPGQGAAGP